MEVERRRLQAVLASDDKPDASVAVKKPRKEKDAGVADAAVVAPPQTLWEARLALDRARLDFLSLPPQKRKGLLAAHAARQAKSVVGEDKTSQAQKKVEAAAEERKKALEDARRARSEAQRLVAEERVRLLGVKEEQAKFEAGLAKTQEQIAKRAETTLGFRRRVTGLVAERKSGDASADEADRAYDELVKYLRQSRTDLSTALTKITSGDSGVPRAGPDRLDTAGASVDRSEVDKLRSLIETQAEKLQKQEDKLSWSTASALLEQVEALNRDRLTLYPYLTGDKRASLTSFSAPGIDQARAEGRQVTLVTRYHVMTSASWIAKLRDPGTAGLREVLATFSLLKILVLIGVFVWWRRRAKGVLALLSERVQQTVVESRSARVPVYAERTLALLERVERPASWLLFVWLVMWLAGPPISELYETRILWLVLGWTLGGVIVVHTIDAFFASRASLVGRQSTDELRLRSLKLMGRVIVAVGLTLALTSELVGQGTIYSWVLSTCWFAALPIGLVIVRWWKPVVFERVAGTRRKNAFVAWVERNESGWVSFPAATSGGVYLIAVGVGRVVRAYVSGFNLTRRLLAYLFRREVAKQARDRESGATHPLDEEQMAALDPEAGASFLLPTVGDEEIQAVTQAIDAPGGGVFAVVGERGMGKSMLLGRMLAAKPDSLLVECPVGGMGPFRQALYATLDLPPDASDEDVKRVLNEKQHDNALLVDDAHRLVRPTIGGLDDFDWVLALARESSVTTTWVFCMGSIIWQYVERARGARPLFDEVIAIRPWSEENIAELLRRRSSGAGIEPSFEGLIAEPEEDEELKQEQLARTQASYYRLLWDYAGGNPAVAVHFWRESLSVSPDGDVSVQLFSAPDTSDLERLPDPAVFVLRAVVQLELAAVDDIVEATMLSRRQVLDALRYASFRGYLEQADGRYRVAWNWFRAITRFLQRRHLLARGSG